MWQEIDEGALVRHTRAMRAIARALVHDEHGADDVTQAAWLAALERPPRVLSRAWLRRAVGSRAHDELRRRQRSVVTLADVDDHAVEAAAELAAERLEAAAVLAAALARLSEPYRTALHLRWFEERPPQEIARLLGVPTATVKTRLLRGLALLREDLERRHSRRDLSACLVSIGGLAPEPPPSTFAPLLHSVLALKPIIAAAVVVLVAVLTWLAWGGEPNAHTPLRDVAARDVADEGSHRDLALGDTPTRRASVEQESAPSSAPAPNTASGSVVVEAFWYDGAPAGDVEVVLLAAHSASVREPERLAVTRDDGRTRFDGLEPGTWDLVADRGWRGSANVVAAAVATVRVDIPRGVDVSGRVVDDHGRPVGGASVRLSTDRGDWLEGREAARSAADGRFVLRSVPELQSLGATAAGHAPSALVDLELVAVVDGRAEIELVLLPGGAQLSGVVVDEDGAPVAGALVALGDPARHVFVRNDGTQIEASGPVVVRSDEAGRFRFEGLAPGATTLTIRAAGFAISHAAIELVAQPTPERRCVLQRGAVLTGSVTTADGTPLAGAIVAAFDEPLPVECIGLGRIEFCRVFGHPRTVSDARGAFVLASLPPGPLHLYAFASEPHDDIAVPRAQELLHVRPGESFTWHAVIDGEPSITGRVEFANGRPAADLYVESLDEVDGTRAFVRTRSDGSFEFFDLPLHTFTLRAEHWDAPDGARGAELRAVAPSRGVVVLSLDHDDGEAFAYAVVSGSLVDEADRVPDGVVVGATLHGEDRRSGDMRWDGAHFTFPRVEPGRWRVVLTCRGAPVATSPWFDVESGARIDLGALVTAPGGALELAIARGEGTFDRAAVLDLEFDDGLAHDSLSIAAALERVVVPNLPVGRVRGRVHGEGLEPVSFECVVAPFGTAAARIELVRD